MKTENEYDEPVAIQDRPSILPRLAEVPHFVCMHYNRFIGVQQKVWEAFIPAMYGLKKIGFVDLHKDQYLGLRYAALTRKEIEEVALGNEYKLVQRNKHGDIYERVDQQNVKQAVLTAIEIAKK